jgi:hypothetical protein
MMSGSTVKSNSGSFDCAALRSGWQHLGDGSGRHLGDRARFHRPSLGSVAGFIIVLGAGLSTAPEFCSRSDAGEACCGGPFCGKRTSDAS